MVAYFIAVDICLRCVKLWVHYCSPLVCPQVKAGVGIGTVVKAFGNPLNVLVTRSTIGLENPDCGVITHFPAKEW